MKSLKILFLTDRFSLGGAETHILSLCRALTLRGHSVTVASSGGALSRSVNHIALDLSSRSPIKLILGYFRLRRLILREGFDLIHAHARLPALVASLVSRSLNVPFVTTVHARFKTDPLRRAFSSWGFRSVAVSEDLRFYLTQSYSIPSENVTVIENGIDFGDAPVKFQPKKKNDFTLLFLSRLDFDCSLCAELLCDLAPLLFSRYPNIKIVIGGGGERFFKIRAYAERINRALRAEVVFAVGEVKDVSSFLASGDLFVGVSRAALEALASGLPVIIAGNEGFLGRLREENFSRALAANFCARGECLPSAELLFAELCSAIDSYSELLEETSRVYLMARSLLDISRIALRYEDFYFASLRGYARMSEKRAHTLLFGYYGYSNLGDNALLRAAANRAELEFGRGAAAFTHKPRKTSRTFAIRCFSRSSPFSLAYRLLRCKRLIFGGGTLFQDSTSKRSLLFYLTVLRLAQTLKRDTLLYANGIGDIKSPFLRSLFLKTLSRCSYIGLRDMSSVELLKSWGFDTDSVVLEADLALSLLPSTRERAEFLLGFALDELSKSFFAVCPRGSSSRFERFELELAVRRQKNKGLVPLFISSSPDDEHLCLALKRKFGGAFLSRLSFSDLLSLFPFASCVISMRYHPLLASRSLSVPYISIGNDIKLKEFK